MNSSGFISELQKRLINDEQFDNFSGNEKFAEFNFVGLKETPLTVDLFAFVKADGMTQKQISELCDKFFNVTQIVSYDDFGLNPGPRNPNGLICFVFEDECSTSLVDFIKTQTKISHWKRSAVTVSWSIEVKNKRIHTHNNPVSVFPPVIIMEGWVFPGLNYLKSFVSAYRPQSIPVDNDIEAILQSFRRLEERVEEAYRLFKSIPRQQYQYFFSNAKIATIISESETYIKNSNVEGVTMNNLGDTYNIGQAGAVGRYARSDNNKFFQAEQKQTLADAAVEIQKLLKQLEQTNPSATDAEKIAYVNDETTPSFKRRVVGAFQAGGEAAIEEFLDNPYVNIGKAVIKGWIKPE